MTHEIETRSMKKSRRPIIIGAVVVVLCAAFGVGVFVWMSATNNPEQLVSCDEMPTLAQAQEAIDQNPELVAKLKATGPESQIMVEPLGIAECSTNTVEKAEIRVYVATEAQREAANVILEEESFDGVPATAVNV